MKGFFISVLLGLILLLNAEPILAGEPMEIARQDLAERLGVEFPDIEVVVIKEVVWSDTCLGMPATEAWVCEPVETPGYKIIFANARQLYLYHTDEGKFFLFVGPVNDPMI